MPLSPTQNEYGNKTRRVDGLIRLGAWVGMISWLGWGIYRFCLWRMTPESPDKEHVMGWIQHGRTHYLTAGQHDFYSHFKTVAWVGLAACAVLGIIQNLLLRRNKPAAENSPI